LDADDTQSAKITVALHQTVTVLFGNKHTTEIKCCQFGLMLFNTWPTRSEGRGHSVKSRAIVGLYSEEAPDFTLTQLGNQYIIERLFPQRTGGFFPQTRPRCSTWTSRSRWSRRCLRPRRPCGGSTRRPGPQGELLKLECQDKVGEEDFDYDGTA